MQDGPPRAGGPPGTVLLQDLLDGAPVQPEWLMGGADTYAAQLAGPQPLQAQEFWQAQHIPSSQAQGVGEAGWVPQQSGAAAAASGAGGSQFAGRLDPATMATKLAAAREKNRMAQQRFRERQRAKQQEAGVQCDELQQEMEQLLIENQQLATQNGIYAKVLAVRDAMLHTLASLHPPEHLHQQQHSQQQQQQQQQHVEQQQAALGLARALEALPSELEIDAAAAAADAIVKTNPQQQQQQQGQGQQRPELSANAAPLCSSGSCPSANTPGGGPEAAAEHPRLMLGEPHRGGTAAHLDGSALQRVESIPPASNEVVRAAVLEMTEPEDLLDYYRQWQAELSLSYQAAEACGFDAASVAEVEAIQERMAAVWWHVGQMKPAYLCFLAHAALPEDSGQFPLWRDIATHILPQLDENRRAILRRAWFSYSKQLAKIAIKVSRWVRQLQEFTVRPLEAMATTAGSSMELVHITSQLCSAVQDEYLASMEFIAEQSPATSELQKAMMNKEAAPYMPDVVAIVYQVLMLDSQERRAQQAVDASAAGCGTFALPCPPSPLPAPAASGSTEQEI